MAALKYFETDDLDVYVASINKWLTAGSGYVLKSSGYYNTGWLFRRTVYYIYLYELSAPLPPPTLEINIGPITERPRPSLEINIGPISSIR